MRGLIHKRGPETQKAQDRACHYATSVYPSLIALGRAAVPPPGSVLSCALGGGDDVRGDVALCPLLSFRLGSESFVAQEAEARVAQAVTFVVSIRNCNLLQA